MGQLNLVDKQQVIAEQIIGNLDDDGYLRRDISSIVDDLAFRQNIGTVTLRRSLEYFIGLRQGNCRFHSHFSLMHQDYETQIPDYSGYLKRKVLK
ncbi:MAG: hypothetical protein WDM90_15475 [Ferruginibacter sp.]